MDMHVHTSWSMEYVLHCMWRFMSTSSFPQSRPHAGSWSRRPPREGPGCRAQRSPWCWSSGATPGRTPWSAAPPAGTAPARSGGSPWSAEGSRSRSPLALHATSRSCIIYHPCIHHVRIRIYIFIYDRACSTIYIISLLLNHFSCISCTYFFELVFFGEHIILSLFGYRKNYKLNYLL